MKYLMLLMLASCGSAQYVCTDLVETIPKNGGTVTFTCDGVNLPVTIKTTKPVQGKCQ